MPVSDPWTLYADDLAAMRRQKTAATAAGDAVKAARIQQDIDAFLSTVIPNDTTAENAALDAIPVRRASDGSLREMTVGSLRADLQTAFNVKDYQASGLGVLNDTAEIQAAIDAAVAAGGGVVLIPAGTYLLSDQGASWTGFRYALRIASASSASIIFRGVGKASVLKMATHNDADAVYDAFFDIHLSTGRIRFEDLAFETPAVTTVGQGRVAITIGEMGGAAGAANSGTLEEVSVERCYFNRVSFALHGEGTKRAIFRDNIVATLGGGLYPTYFSECINLGSRAGTYHASVLIEGNKFDPDEVNGDHVFYLLGSFEHVVIRANEWSVCNHDAIKFSSWSQAGHESGTVVIEGNVDTRAAYNAGDAGGEAVFCLITTDGGTTGTYRQVIIRDNRVRYAHQFLYSECAFDLMVIEGNVARSCEDIAIHMVKKATLALRGHCVIAHNDFDDVNVSNANNISIKIEAFLSAAVIGNRAKTVANAGRFIYHAGIEWATYVGNFASNTSYNYELGEWSNFNSQGNSWDSGIIAKVAAYAAGDTTPSVKGATAIILTNAGATVITQFDDGVVGQEITVTFTGATPNTTLSNANFYMAGGASFVGTQHDCIRFIYTGAGFWKEVSRSVN